jgi:hypothetical protein
VIELFADLPMQVRDATARIDIASFMAALQAVN